MTYSKLTIASLTALLIALPATAQTSDDFQKLFTLNGPIRAMGVERVYDDFTLTPGQLAACLKDAKQLNLDAAKIDETYEKLQAERDNIGALGEEIDDSGAYLESHPTKEVNDEAAQQKRAELVERHNNLTDEYNRWITQYQKDQETYADMADQFDIDQERFAEKCSQKQYYAEDLKSIQMKN